MQPDVLVIRHPASGAPHFVAKHARAARRQRRRRHARAPDAGAARRVHHPPRQGHDRGARRSPSAATSPHSPRRALQRAPAHARSARRCASRGPRTLMPPASRRSACEVFDRIEPALEGADVVMMLRIQRERLERRAPPQHARVQPHLRPQRGAPRARQARRDRHAPGADEPRRGDRSATSPTAAERDPRSGRGGRRRAHGRALPPGRGSRPVATR